MDTALEARVAALKSEHPEKPVEVWAEDETRLGLLPGSSTCMGEKRRATNGTGLPGI